MADILDMDLFDDEDQEKMPQHRMDDEVVKSIMQAIKGDEASMVGVLKASIWDIYIKGSRSQRTFSETRDLILTTIPTGGEEVFEFLRSKISAFATQIVVEDSVVNDILQNTCFSGKKIRRGTRVNDIPNHDLAELTKRVLTACDLNNPWYMLWHFSRDVTRIYSPFNPTSYPGYFEASNMKDMLTVALNICNMERSAASVCVLEYATKRYEIKFMPLSDLLEHKFVIKASKRFDKFITYDGSTIKLRALTLYDIQLLKYLIKHFDCDASQSIYQMLSSMMVSERDIKLAHDIGWFSGISLDAFTESHLERYLLANTRCQRDAFCAIKHISRDCDNLFKGFTRDFKFQASTSPANIWIAVTSLVFALVSVIQFFMSL
ncbi:hypothetical protein EDD11_008507 [Mortierella claussenii]|nr:hypothetical protein EDD11_008507 [Mortierella claussenii]